ncbi:hypothetical protein TNCT_469481 [Trichonephila clavata]|uniref:Uncharacterized protein n=1 Tax=Trichonephila clavata TaxID=2740835 RepID=A0A8X6H8U5_TRICU|nr:hypothetical protein TNCT_469481 [Trichonephila clavata]
MRRAHAQWIPSPAREGITIQESDRRSGSILRYDHFIRVANHTKHLCSGVTHSKEGYYPISFGVRRVKEGPSRREQTKRNLRSRQYDPQVGASEKFTFYRLRFSIFNLQQWRGSVINDLGEGIRC